MNDDQQYRQRLETEVEILQLMPLKELRLWTREEIKAVVTRTWIAELALHPNTVLTDAQFWKIAEHRFPGRFRAAKR